MKKSKIIYSMIAIVAVMACNKVGTNEQPVSNEEENGYGVIYATTESTKTTIAGTGINERVEWVKGDKLYVFPKASNDFNGIEYIAQNSGSTATFIGQEASTIVGAIYPSVCAVKCLSGSSGHGPKLQAEIFAEQDGSFRNLVFAGVPKESGSKQLLFTAVSSVIKITVPAEKKIVKILLKSNQDICGRFNAECNSAYGNNTWVVSNTTTNMGKEINVSAPQGTCFSGDVYVAVLPYSSTSDITITFYSQERFGSVTKTGVPALKYNTIEDFGTARVKMPSYCKAFSIEEGRQVFFSPGNLQYQASTQSWRFAEHQWDFVGGEKAYMTTTDGIIVGKETGRKQSGGTVSVDGVKSSNASIDKEYDGWIDLFCLGTSGFDTKYPPYFHPSNNDDYNSFNFNSDSRYDWGHYCDISNATPNDKNWFTMTWDQWLYLFRRGATTDQVTSSNKWGVARILVDEANSVYLNGDIILPDIFSLPEGLNFKTMNQTPLSYREFDVNTFTITQLNELVAAGAVFLPCAGHRDNKTVNLVNVDNYVGTIGVYSTTDKTGALQFNNPQSNSSYIANKGRAVRLVRDVPAE